MTFYYQFSLFENYPKPRESIIKLISKLIGCENDLPLLEALGTAIENFIKLPTDICLIMSGLLHKILQLSMNLLRVIILTHLPINGKG